MLFFFTHLSWARSSEGLARKVIYLSYLAEFFKLSEKVQVMIWSTSFQWRFIFESQVHEQLTIQHSQSLRSSQTFNEFYPTSKTILLFDPTVSRHLQLLHLVQVTVSHAHFPPMFPMNFDSGFPSKCREEHHLCLCSSHNSFWPNSCSVWALRPHLFIES